MRDVTNYHGVKYSLQPHGLRSKLVYYFAAFVVAFGGALLAASPVDAAPGDMSCFVELPPPSPDPSASPSSSPSPVVSPTPCPSPSTSTTTVTVPGPVTTVTKVETKTVYVTEQVTPNQTPSPTEPATSDSSSFRPELGPGATTSTVVFFTKKSGNGSLVGWAVGIAILLAIALVGAAVVGVARRRRKIEEKQEQEAAYNYQAAHAVNNDLTQVIPAVPADDDEYGVSDYRPELGGWAGESFRSNSGKHSADDDTVVTPLVSADPPTPGDADTRPPQEPPVNE